MADTEQFEHYHVLRRDDGSLWELGRGAMGVTYKAFDTDLHCDVALKVIAPAILGSEEAGQRFLREARSLARLRHPNIATIFRLGRTGEGSYFYAMEFCEGQTLQQLVEQQGPLVPAVAMEIGGQVSKALILAEDHRLVHRDLKPANLILTHRRDEGMVIKVIDFGLAKNYGVAQEQGSAWASLSSAGFIGTAHFASPEQLEEQELDTRADIYSLGATLWFLLTGKPMFEGSLAKIMNQHLSAPAPLERLRGLTPPTVVALLGRMLEKDRDLRPANAEELRREMQACLQALRRGDGGDGGNSESAETIALPEHVPDAPLAGARYRLLEEKPHGRSGQLFRAVDTAERGAPVAVRIFDWAWTGTAGAFAEFAAEVEKVLAHPHPHFLRVHSLTRGPDGLPWLVTEWVTGVTLLELLRARRTLGLRATLSLLGPLAAAVDHATVHDFPLLELEKHQIFFHFPDGTPEEDAAWMHRPSTEWPAFVVKLNALGLVADLADTAVHGLAAMATMLPGATARAAAVSSSPRDYPRELAALTYELLGGANLGTTAAAPAPKYVPISRLTEAGNTVLQHALCSAPGQGCVSAQELFDALGATAGYESMPHGQAVPARPATVPPPGAVPVRRLKKGWKISALAALALLLLGGAVLYFLPDPEQNAAPATPAASPAVGVANASSVTPPPEASAAPVADQLKADDLEAKLLASSSEDRIALLRSHPGLVTNDFIGKLGEEGDRLVREGRVESAKDRFTLITQAADVAGNRTAHGVALVSRGDIYRNMGQMNEAMQDYLAAREIAATVTDNVMLRAMAAHGIGVTDLKLARWPDAATAFQEEIPLDKDVPNKASLSDAWNNLGVAYMGMNNYPEAIKALETSRTVAQNVGFAAGVNQAQQNIDGCRRLMGGTPANPARAPGFPSSQPTFPGEQFPVTRLRPLTPEEASRLSPGAVRYAINELYARHGADFRDKQIKSAFQRFAWYNPVSGKSYDNVETEFTEIEKYNVNLLGTYRDAQKRSGLPMAAAPPVPRQKHSPPNEAKRAGATLNDRTHSLDNL